MTKRRNGYDANTLPKWAQRELERLDKEIENLRRANAALGSGEPTKVHLSATAFPEEGVYVQDNTRVGFTVDGGTVIAHVEHGRLTLMGSSRHSSVFSVRPNVSNVVTVGFEVRR